jgi:branched-chain amino acid transport system substrate-binding protein
MLAEVGAILLGGNVLRVRWLAVLTCLLAAFAVGMTACGGDDDDGGGGGGGGNELTVYSSLPLQGAQRLQTLAVVDGIKLALKQRGGKVGDFTFKYESLDDSTAQAGTWTPEATSANARKAAQDESTIAYIGEFNSGASAISIPILNEVPIPQISPANTGVGLTSDEPGAAAGEPEKYYPTGVRHYLRVVPKDTIQGAALATLMKEDGCTKLAILNDKEVYGAGLSRNIEGSAKQQGIEVTGNEGIDPKAPNFRSQAAAIKSDGADCFVFSGVTPNGAVQLYKDIAAALPDAKLYGPDGVSNPEFYNPEEGGVPPDIGSRVKITVATLDPEQYPPEGQKFFRDFKKEYGVENPDVYSIYGYEAMSLVLDTCEQLGAECSDKQAMVDALHNVKNRKSVLGTYDIDENGDTTITDYGVYTVKGGELVFDQTIKAAG